MRQSIALAAAGAATVQALSLAEMCTVANVQAALPADGSIPNVTMIASSVSASPVYNASLSSGFAKRDTTTYSYCNVTATYTHGSDSVIVWYGFPDPSIFENRFYVVGGGGYSLSVGVTGGLEYGAVTGCTDAGYDAFTNSLDAVVLNSDGTLNEQNIKMFSYEALGMSQVQRYGDLYDGIATGAPAFRQAQQQVLHLFSSVAEVVQNYFPTNCALDKIVNATIEACDPLDGRTDGSIIGQSYACAAETSSSLGFGFSKRQAAGSTTTSSPAQNGTINEQDIAIAQTIYDGLFTSSGKRAYLSFQIGAELEDAVTEYDNTTGAYTYEIPNTGGVFVAKFLEQIDEDSITTLENVDYDTLFEWMEEGLAKFLDTLQTTMPDISAFRDNGAKLLHYHGESDPSVPAASSVHYYDSVRTVLYPSLGYNESVAKLDDFYRFFTIPGAAHCNTNSLQPGPWPNDLVEDSDVPDRLNSTVTAGSNEGEVQLLCKWPTRPLWTSETAFDCVYDQASIDSWTYVFDAFNQTIY
ncbi:tannase [Botrytis cinerea]